MGIGELAALCTRAKGECKSRVNRMKVAGSPHGRHSHKGWRGVAIRGVHLESSGGDSYLNSLFCGSVCAKSIIRAHRSSVEDLTDRAQRSAPRPAMKCSCFFSFTQPAKFVEDGRRQHMASGRFVPHA